MEKASLLFTHPTVAKLLARAKKTKDRLLFKLFPKRSNDKIESRLLIPNAHKQRTFSLPKGFEQFNLRTRDGVIQVYQIGVGPCVIFNHGWGGGGHQFFALMRGLSHCGFSSISFDHFGHGLSDPKPATLAQTITTTNHIINYVKNLPNEEVAALVGHSTGCIAIGNASSALLRKVPLFLIAPVFNYKRFFLKRLVQLQLGSELVSQYTSRFSSVYQRDLAKLELTERLEDYSDHAVIVHDESDQQSPVADSIAFSARCPLTRLLVTKQYDHQRVINSESVWQELKSSLNYDDTTINFTAEVGYSQP